MSWYPQAVQRPMPYNGQMPARRQAKALCIHTNGGGTDNGSLYGWFSRAGNTVASHFQVFTDGTIEQYIPVSRQAYAEVQGNDHCVSIETQDDGHPSRPWTTEQIDAILGICRWLGVPAQVASETGDGVNWHSLYADYNPHVHACPGSVRVGQIKKTLIPELAGDDMADVMVPTSDNNPHHKPGTLLPLAEYLQELSHEIFAIRELTQKDLAVDKTQK